MISTVARRYAEALFDVAKDKKALKKVREEMDALTKLADTSDDFTAFLRNPVIKDEGRVAVFDQALKNTKSPTRNFLRLLVDKKRTAILPDIGRAFAELHDEAEGILQVTVTAAQAFSAAQSTALSTKLAAKYNKKIVLQTEVDEELLGGFRYRIGDEITDLSISHKLEQFRMKVLNT